MPNRIRVPYYRFEFIPATATNKVTVFGVKSIDVDDIIAIDPVNSLGGQDVAGLPYLYAKITQRQPGVNQELFVLSTVLQVHDACNASS